MTEGCDLLLRGGHLIDPKNGIDGPADIAIKDGCVTAVGTDLQVEAERLVDVGGRFVTPGLISGRARLGGRQKLECRLTLREGRILWDQYGLSCPSWEEAGEYRMLENPLA